MCECVCMCLHAKTIKERRGHEFKTKQGEAYRRVLSEEREPRDGIIILISKSKTKQLSQKNQQKIVENRK